MTRGTMYRWGLELHHLGIKLRWVWLIDLGDRIKRSAMEDYV